MLLVSAMAGRQPLQPFKDRSATKRQLQLSDFDAAKAEELKVAETLLQVAGIKPIIQQAS